MSEPKTLVDDIHLTRQARTQAEVQGKGPHHVAITRDGEGAVRLYVNGEPIFPPTNPGETFTLEFWLVPAPPKPCLHCDGTGFVMEQVDDDRLPIRVRCPLGCK